MPRATINYQTHEFQAGVSILDALRSLKIEIPTLCHDDRLKPCGSCRLCLVDVQGSSHPLAACDTKLADGMVIESHSPELEKTRRLLLTEIAEHYPADEVGRFPEKPFHRWLIHYGLGSECLGRITPLLLMIRVPTFTWICRSASPVTAACEFAKSCRGNSSGANRTRGSFPIRE